MLTSVPSDIYQKMGFVNQWINTRSISSMLGISLLVLLMVLLFTFPPITYKNFLFLRWKVPDDVPNRTKYVISCHHPSSSKQAFPTIRRVKQTKSSHSKGWKCLRRWCLIECSVRWPLLDQARSVAASWSLYSLVFSQLASSSFR